METMKYLILAAYLLSCTHQAPENPQTTATPPVPEEAKIKSTPAEPKPMQRPKSAFVDYAYMIQPELSTYGAGVETDEIEHGYLRAFGPWDGFTMVFHLFKGDGFDLVIEQTTGDVKKEDGTYGSRLRPFMFTDGKMTKKKVGEVLPLKTMKNEFDKAFEQGMKDKSLIGWGLYRYLKIPIEGTTLKMMMCKKLPEPPFSIDTECRVIGLLEWDKKKFNYKKVKDQFITKETI